MAGFDRRTLLAAGAAAVLSAGRAWGASGGGRGGQALADLLAYVRAQNTTGFLVIRDGRTIVERNWPQPADDRAFAPFAYERNAQGALLEDVASQQKSFVALLVAIAMDRGLIDVGDPVSRRLGTGWSKATAEQEGRIRIVDVLTMSSGLDPNFAYRAPPGAAFLYNTPVYAITKRILEVAAGASLDAITRQWLAGPAGMTDTRWRMRPAALADAGNPTGLVTSPRDIARFGALVLNDGIAAGGRRIVSRASLHSLFARSAANPAYGRLWWLNGGDYTITGAGIRREGPLIRSAPADLVAALGALDRRLYVVPSERTIVVRTGAAVSDPAFDERLWTKLAALRPADAT